MRIFDISMTISGSMPVYKNLESKKPVITVDRDFAAGGVWESRIAMNLHTGTHLDAPLHILPGGSTTDSFDLNKFISPCTILDLSRLEEKITADDLKDEDIRKDAFVLFKTKNSDAQQFETDFVYLASSGAEYLLEKGVLGAGIDALGIERGQRDHNTHRILLQNGIMILEGLRLYGIEKGAYTLIVLPLKIKGVEAAPARAVLVSG